MSKITQVTISIAVIGTLIFCFVFFLKKKKERCRSDGAYNLALIDKLLETSSAMIVTFQNKPVNQEEKLIIDHFSSDRWSLYQLRKNTPVKFPVKTFAFDLNNFLNFGTHLMSKKELYTRTQIKQLSEISFDDLNKSWEQSKAEYLKTQRDISNCY